MLEWIWLIGLTAFGWALWRLWASGCGGVEKWLVELWAYGSGFLSSRRTLAAVLAVNLALPWLLYGWRVAVEGRGVRYDFFSAYAGVFTGLALVVLASFAIGRLLPVGVRRAARRAWLGEIEREQTRRIERLRDRLDRAERELDQTRAARVQEAGAVE